MIKKHVLTSFVTHNHKNPRLPPEIDHLTKMDKNNEFKMAAAAILNSVYRS